MSTQADVSFQRDREFRFERRHFEKIAALLYRLAGIHLAPHKFEMMYARLVRRLRSLGLTDFDAYCALLDDDDAGAEEIGYLVNAMTTNLTAFFREPHHFTHLAQITLPGVVETQEQRQRPRLRIWSAGCSSGPEPYTIAMVLIQSLPNLRSWDARVLATDIDTRMIETARQGIYPAAYADSIPAQVRSRFAKPTSGRKTPAGAAGAAGMRAEDATIVMSQELKALITFKGLNLLEPWPMKGPFDAIFCRNVLIYFDRSGRTETIDRFAGILAPRGFLYLGHSETLHGISNRFQQEGSTIYRRVA